MSKKLLLVILLLLQGCLTTNDISPGGGDSDKLSNLSGTWFTDKALFEQEDYTSYWVDLVITFSVDDTYETQGSADFAIWPESGSYDFAETTGTGVINRSDGAVITIDKLTDKVFNMSMDLGSKGRWKFFLKK